jgi:hypothetical protein
MAGPSNRLNITKSVLKAKQKGKTLLSRTLVCRSICRLKCHAIKKPYGYSTTLFKLQRTYIAESVTLREEHRLRVFESRVLRGIFGPKRDGVTGEWRRLHNEELYDLY